MIVVGDFLDKIYKRKKDGKISHHATNFMKKHGLDISDKISTQQAIILATSISNAEKRNSLVKELLGQIETKKEKTPTINLREVSYKKACQYYHPDNQDTGNDIMFKFIQDIKFAFWNYKGEPRRAINNYDWKREKIDNEQEHDDDFMFKN